MDLQIAKLNCNAQNSVIHDQLNVRQLVLDKLIFTNKFSVCARTVSNMQMLLMDAFCDQNAVESLRSACETSQLWAQVNNRRLIVDFGAIRMFTNFRALNQMAFQQLFKNFLGIQFKQLNFIGEQLLGEISKKWSFWKLAINFNGQSFESYLKFTFCLWFSPKSQVFHESHEFDRVWIQVS